MIVATTTIALLVIASAALTARAMPTVEPSDADIDRAIAAHLADRGQVTL